MEIKLEIGTRGTREEFEDPYEITDRIFTDIFAANKASN